MSRFGLAALAGLGSAAAGLPQGMDAAEKERLAQEDRLQRQQGIDETRRYHEASLGLQREQFERQGRPVNVELLRNHGMLPPDAPATIDRESAPAILQAFLAKATEQRKAEREMQRGQQAADALERGRAVPETGMGPVRPPRHVSDAATLLRTLGLTDRTSALLGGVVKPPDVKLQGFGTDQDVYETPAGGTPRLVRPGTPKPKEPNQGQRREELIDALLVQKGYQPGTKEFNEQKFNAMRTIPVTEGGMVFGGGQMIPDRVSPTVAGQPGGPTPLAKGPQKPIEAAAAQLVVGGEAARRAAKEALDALSDATVQQYIGPYAQYLAAIQRGAPKQALGEIPEVVVKLEQNASRVTNYAIKLITGAQMSEPEAKRIMRELPQFGQQPKEFAQRMQATLDNIATMEARVNSLVTRGATPVGPDAQNAAKPSPQTNAVSRRDPRYQRARAAGLDDNAIMKKYGITLVD